MADRDYESEWRKNATDSINRLDESVKTLTASMAANNEILKQVVSSQDLIANIIKEHRLHMESQETRHDEKIGQMNERITKHNNKIVAFSAGLSVLVFLIMFFKEPVSEFLSKDKPVISTRSYDGRNDNR